jgi:hypothetical protein
MTRYRFRQLLAVLTASAVIPLGGTAHASPVAVTETAAVPVPGEVLGAYQSAIRDSTGRMNVAATIQRLTDAHVNTYWYLVCHFAPYSQLEWDQLPEFLAAAQQANIKVWVYLCPPSEASTGSPRYDPALPPYQWDYPAWAQHIAEYSLTYPNLVGYTMDDFIANSTKKLWSTYFTPQYAAQMVNAGKAVNPALKFSPIMYYPDMVGLDAQVAPYRSLLDGVIFPYRNESHEIDTINSANMTPESKATSQTVSCANGPQCYQISFPRGTDSAVNWNAGVQQQVTVQPASSYSLTFTYSDDYLDTTSGYHYFEITVDGTPVWSEDIAGNRGVRRAAADLTAALSGKTTATIGLRLRDKKAVGNFHVTVTFDDLVPAGFTVANPSFEGTTGWTSFRSSSQFTLGYVKDLPKVDMIYAAMMVPEQGAPSVSYVSDATSRALALTPSRYNIGTVTYQLNITDADIPNISLVACYPAVANLYAQASS